MIPLILHMIWVNDDSPIEIVQAAAASWAATGLPLRMWTHTELVAEFGSCDGPANAQANYYRTKILGTLGGFYVDADSFAQPVAGDVLRRILPAADIIAATLPNGQYNNAPMGAVPGLPDWDWLAADPVNHFHRWNQWLRKQSHFTTLPGELWNASKPGDGVLCVHKIGSLAATRGKPMPSIRTFPLPDGSLAQQAEDWQVCALRKSGHHAVMRWAANLTGQTLWHFNDCVVGSRPGTFRLGTKAVLQEGDVPPLRLCNFEDSGLQGLIADTRLLVIRHPWNCFASRIKGTSRFPQLDWLNTDLWKLHAREYLNPDSPFIKINFDRWHSSRDYRADIATNRLGYFFDKSNDCRSCVPEVGQSMFDGRTFDGRAETMDVLNRWQLLQDNPDMQRIMADEELRELWQRIEAMP
jgi:hypothetical protein